jgi:flagellar export protein FliJ
MKTRAALIRYNEWQVDERRKVLAELFAAIEELDRQDDRLTISTSLEQVLASQSEIGQFGYGGFAQGVIERRFKIEQSRAFLEAQIAGAQEELQLAFQELKKIQIMEERRKAKERKERDRLEQAELDEIAQNRHTARK